MSPVVAEMNYSSRTFTLDGIYHFEFFGATNNTVNILLQVNGNDTALTAMGVSFSNGNISMYAYPWLPPCN